MKKKIKVEEEHILCDICGTHLTTRRLPYTVPKTEIFRDDESELGYFDLCFQHLIDYNDSGLTLKEYILKKREVNYPTTAKRRLLNFVRSPGSPD